MQDKALAFLNREWNEHAPFTKNGWYGLKTGSPREWFRVPAEYRVRLGTDKQPHPFANVYSVWLFSERCSQRKFVSEKWPEIKRAVEDFLKSGWRLDPAKGDAFGNQYLASMMAAARLAEEAKDSATAEKANSAADEFSDMLVQWWNRVATNGTLKSFSTSSELDPYIGKGGGISLALAPHRHKLALFDGLTPEIAAMLRARVPDAIDSVWKTFSLLYRTSPLVGEERQVHTGENFIDPPELALAGFKAFAWLKNATAEELAMRVDLPFCHAELYYISKLAIALDGK